MTDDEPLVPRPRRLRTIIFQILFLLVSLQTLYTMLHTASDPVKEWPQELAASRGSYCKIDDYARCRENDWFGIMKSKLPQGSTAILNEICLEWKDKPDPARGRLIEAADGDLLYLCRMKAPAAAHPEKAKQ